MSNVPFALVADPAKVALAKTTIARRSKEIGEDIFWGVLRELWLDQHLQYNELGRLGLRDITDLQLIAIAAAVSSVDEKLSAGLAILQPPYAWGGAHPGQVEEVEVEV